MKVTEYRDIRKSLRKTIEREQKWLKSKVNKSTNNWHMTDLNGWSVFVIYAPTRSVEGGKNPLWFVMSSLFSQLFVDKYLLPFIIFWSLFPHESRELSCLWSQSTFLHKKMLKLLSSLCYIYHHCTSDKSTVASSSHKKKCPSLVNVICSTWTHFFCSTS